MSGTSVATRLYTKAPAECGGIHDLLLSHFRACRAGKEKEVVASKINIACARSRVRAPLGTSPSVSVTSVKAVRMPTSILGWIATLYSSVYALLLANCSMYAFVDCKLVSLQKYSRKKELYLKKGVVS